NGFKVDVQVAEARVVELTDRRNQLMKELVDEWGFPTEGKQPWKSKEGKEAILRVLAHHNITPENTPNWAKTATGNISFGGKEIMEITEGTEAEEFGEMLAELNGQRSLAQLALDSVHADGFSHPD